MSNVESLLSAILTGKSQFLVVPQSRVEELLYAIYENGGTGGGGGVAGIKYLGVIDDLTKLSTTAKKGDYYLSGVSDTSKNVHVGDMLIAQKDSPAATIDNSNYRLLHTEMDSDTTYTLTQDNSDGHILYFKASTETGTGTKITIPDNDTDNDKKTSSANLPNVKLYLIGAETQTTTGVTTYSNSNVYIDSSNRLCVNNKPVLTSHITAAEMKLTSYDKGTTKPESIDVTATDSVNDAFKKVSWTLDEKVNTSRKINDKDLSADVTLAGNDVKLNAASYTKDTTSKTISKDTKVDEAVAQLEYRTDKLTTDVSKKANETTISSLDKRVDTLEKIALDTSDAIIAGVEVDYENNVSTRIKGATGKSAGTDYNVFPCFANIRRCNMTADGTVTAYYGDSAFKEDGTNGDVMVEIPKLYYKMTPLKLDGIKIRKAQYMVCHDKLLGFKVHPAFVRDDGSERDAVYVSAYEGSLYDTSASTFISDDAQVADFDNDKMVSIANVKPMSGSSQNLTRANSEKLATNKGNGWHSLDIKTTSLVQMLMLIEYSGNLQSTLGDGVSGKSWTGANEANNTGDTSSSGNASTSGTTSTQSISYRGIENPYASMWRFITGITLSSDTYYISDSEKFVEDTINGYTSVGFNTPGNDSYISAFGYSANYDWTFLPGELGGSSSGIIGDYFWSNSSGNRISLLGGAWYYGSMAGGFCWYLNYDVSYRSVHVGARLCFEG